MQLGFSSENVLVIIEGIPRKGACITLLVKFVSQDLTNSLHRLFLTGKMLFCDFFFKTSLYVKN